MNERKSKQLRKISKFHPRDEREYVKGGIIHGEFVKGQGGQIVAIKNRRIYQDSKKSANALKIEI